VDREDAKILTLQVYDFFRHQGGFEPFALKGDLEYFDSSEIDHLYDVRDLFDQIFVVFLISTVLFVLLVFFMIEKNVLRFFRNFSLVFLISSSVLISLLGLLYLLSSNFPYLFENFHFIFFPQGNWQFPEGSLIITIFPFGFFYDFFFRLVITSFIIAGVLFAAGLIVFISTSIILKRKNARDEAEKNAAISSYLKDSGAKKAGR
jgi:uncharacterized membrane protein